MYYFFLKQTPFRPTFLVIIYMQNNISSLRGVVVCCHCEAWNKPWQSLAMFCHPEWNEGSQGLYYHPPPRSPWDSSLRSEWQHMALYYALSCWATRTLRLSRVQNKFTCYAEAEQGRGTQASPRSRPETALIARSQRGDSSLRSEWHSGRSE